MTDLKIAIAQDPECPNCHESGFDDWWHDPSFRLVTGISAGIPAVGIATLRCHGCGRFFKVTRYRDGETHSTMRGA